MRHLFSIRTIILEIVSFLLIFSAGCQNLARVSGAAPSEEWISADTVALVKIHEAHAFREHWKETAVGTAWADSAVQYWTALQLTPIIEESLEKMGTPGLLDIIGLVKGEASAAIEAKTPEDKTQKATLVLLASFDFGDNEAQAKPLFYENLPKPPRQIKAFPGQTIDVHGSGKNDWASAWMGSRLFLSNSSERLAEHLRSRASGKAPRNSLTQKDTWKQLEPYRKKADDALLYLDMDRTMDFFANPENWSGPYANMDFLWDKFENLFNWLGINAMESSVVAVSMRGKGFYTSTAHLMKDQPWGILFPPRNTQKSLQTPAWIEKDAESFQAKRIQQPLKIKNASLRAIKGISPEASANLDTLAYIMDYRFGPEWDQFLGALGTEFAILVGPKAPLAGSLIQVPGLVLFFELQDTPTAMAALDKIMASFGALKQSQSYLGYHYQLYSTSKLPFPILASEINGFLVIGMQDAWFRKYIDRRKSLTASGEKPDKAAPMGPDSLLPLLEEPFSDLPEDAIVVLRSYSDPGPDMIQMNSSLPIMLPMLNMQLKAYGLPPLPGWIRSAIPPLRPFGENAFPIIMRGNVRGNIVESESWGPFDPLMSPYAAMATIMIYKARKE
ncbi:MAG: hypothetical protein ACLFQ6_12575 [Candidatus Sumerlaeia bacterium]